MNFSHKANTLAALHGTLQSAQVLPQFAFTVAQWQASPQSVLDTFSQDCQWCQSNLIVRSSGVDEDSVTGSLAGQYDSVLDVCGQSQLIDAINRVERSLTQKTDAHCSNSENWIFIQPMLINVRLSGVAFTREPSTNTPYYVLNYSQCGSTESITSGHSNERSTYIAKHSRLPISDSWKSKVIQLCQELETLFSTDALDIEFAFNDQQQLFLFQVRPLIIPSSAVDTKSHKQLTKEVENTVLQAIKPHPYLNGSRSILGIMPDWNPAEIIGIRPNPLALSLYKELITDSTWAYQRNNYGYKQLRSFPLLISLAGQPYIDVRVSFNSFIPKCIPNELAEKLVNHYIEELKKSPEKHDKVEFDIIFSCYTLDIQERTNKLEKCNFSEREIKCLTDSLLTLTNNIIKSDGLWAKDIDKINQLPERRKKIVESKLTLIEKIYWLLEDCKRYGTLPFAGLARAGFIAVQFLNSMRAKKLLSDNDYSDFMASLKTVSSRLNQDYAELSPNAFIKKYGHLRPGTYDINSPRYDKAPDEYFPPIKPSLKYTDAVAELTLTLSQLKGLKQTLEEHGIEHDVISLFNFIKGAIEGREYAKFIFTHSLSDVLELIGQMGAELGFDAQDMAYFDISLITKLYSSSGNIKEIIGESIRQGKKQHQKAHQIVLPPLICNASDIYSFEIAEDEPNFITLKKVKAETVDNLAKTDNLAEKIVLIPSADPGFDWLFSQNIGGLITQYGGVNSHMAIRASELSIPAIIGAGQLLYSKLKKAKLIELDAGNRTVKVLQ